MTEQQIVPLELVDLIKKKPVATYVVLKNNLKLIKISKLFFGAWVGILIKSKD